MLCVVWRAVDHCKSVLYVFGPSHARAAVSAVFITLGITVMTVSAKRQFVVHLCSFLCPPRAVDYTEFVSAHILRPLERKSSLLLCEEPFRYG